MGKRKGKKQWTLSINAALYDRVQAFARSVGLPVRQVVRLALREPPGPEDVVRAVDGMRAARQRSRCPTGMVRSHKHVQMPRIDVPIALVRAIRTMTGTKGSRGIMPIRRTLERAIHRAIDAAEAEGAAK